MRMPRARSPFLAALCALLLLLTGVPARAVAAEPHRLAPQSGPWQLTMAASDTELQVDLTNPDIARIPSGLLLTWLDELTPAGPLSDTFKRNVQDHPVSMGVSQADLNAWVDFDGRVQIVGQTISVIVPVDSAQTAASWWQKLVAGIVGYLTQLAIRVSCYAFFIEGAPLAGPVCAGLGAFTGTMVYNAIVIFVDHKQADPKQWAEALGYSVVAAAGAVAWESGLNDFAKTQMRPLFEKYRASIGEMAGRAGGWIKESMKDALYWLATKLDEFTTYVSDAFVSAGEALFGRSSLPGTLKVMVVGDSMSQGHEGDYTWRYRLWQWFMDQHVSVDFVGPYYGTREPDGAAPPSPPRMQGQTEVDSLAVNAAGRYAAAAAPFDSSHFSVWGRQAAQDKDQIRQQVATYQPDLLLVGLGFNDMGWFVSGPEGTLASMKSLVDNARAAKPDVRFALANVPQRTRIGGRDDLPVNTDRYNAMLAAAIPAWSTANSPVKLVDWRGNYSCEVGGCPAGYDGLHPNALGEFQIAHAFEKTLHDGYGIGASVPAVPTTVPWRPTPVPGGVTATGSEIGFTVTWDPVFGAFGYTVRHRLVGAATWNELHVASNRYDNAWVADGQRWEAQVRTDNGDGVSAWSPVVGATVHPQTAPGPSKIVTHATATGVDVSWTAPTGDHTSSIQRYGVLTYDQDTPGAFVNGVGVAGTSAHIDGLIPGHRYVVAVESWNAAGGGLPSGAPPVLIGGGTPPAPTNLRVTSVDPTTVQLTWDGSAQAAGYRVAVRNINGGAVTYEESAGTSHGIAFLFPGVWNYEFCVTAVNGDAQSGRSNCVIAPRPAGS
ncbi:fibronectin type III domain-containing protein [Micromonospora sp. NPDC000089]|uniref:fibronectin type III domain-containing protein n=1 Tax=unclassified Micromonospora TaxID=2617518 RepID=UPI0036C4D0EA